MKLLLKKNLKMIENESSSFVKLFELEDGSRFYVEPPFYGQLEAIEEREPTWLDRLLDEMIRVVKKNRRVVFTINYHHPLTIKDDYIYLEMRDLLANLNMYFINSSNITEGNI